MDGQDDKPKKPVYKYEPGELDKTRKNIGFIEADEAKKMAQMLGGEVGLEKSAPVDEKAIRKVRSARMTQELREGNFSPRAGKRSESADENGDRIIKSTVTPAAPSQAPTAGTTVFKDILPRLDGRTRSRMDRLMMMPEYGIKTNYGIFNFLNGLRKNGHDRIAEQFVSVTMQTYVSRLSSFQSNVLKLISVAPKSVQEKIARNSALQYKMLRTIGDWSVHSLDTMYKSILRNPSNVTTTSLVNVTRLIYKLVLSVFFIGEQKFVDLLKLVYGEINSQPKVQKEKLLALFQNITADWMYVYQRIPRGMYPLLLRMSCNEYYEFSELFTKQLGKVFNFLGITKYDILLPEKQQEDRVEEKAATQEQTEQAAPQSQADREEFQGAAMGLKILDRLFPGAGWLELDTLPDMYPFYQPLYRFQDGFNLISPENPLQVTVILVKIIEDLFEGCRHLVFEVDKEKSGSDAASASESLSAIINEWSDYREIVFEKLYLPNLRDFVNNLYAQRDFLRNQYGKRLMSNLQWHIYYNFLPYIRFEQLLLDKPSNESKVRILPSRVSVLVEELARITTAADASANAGKGFGEIPNIFSPYKFSLPNVVSQRMNVLLGGGKQKQGSRATNLNLLKYTYAVASVLDWWVNCKTSPAYSGAKVPVCRISPEDGRPVFSVEEREDQNLLFARSIKALAAKGTEEGQPTE